MGSAMTGKKYEFAQSLCQGLVVVENTKLCTLVRMSCPERTAEKMISKTNGK